MPPRLEPQPLDAASLLLYNLSLTETRTSTPLAAQPVIVSSREAHAHDHAHSDGHGHGHGIHAHDHVHGPPRRPALRVVSALTLSAPGRLLAAGAMAATLWLLALWAMT